MAGVQTPAQWHAGELVVLALAGAGKLVIDGGPQRFTAPMPVSPATAPGAPAP